MHQDDVDLASSLTAEAILLARDAVIARRPVLLDDVSQAAYVDEDARVQEPHEFFERPWTAHDDAENARAIERTRVADVESAKDLARQIESLRSTCGPGERVNPYTLEIESGDRYHGTIYEGLDDARTNRVTHAPGGGGASGNKRERVLNKQTEAQREDRRAKLTEPDVPTTRMDVGELTIGEWEFYGVRPMAEARTVLEHRVRDIITGAVIPPPSFTLPKIRRKSTGKRTQIYGLEQNIIDVLRDFPGEAKRALAEYARAKDGDRIGKRDKSHAEQAESRKAKSALTRLLKKKLAA